MFLSASDAAVVYFLRSFAPLSLMMAWVVKVLSVAVSFVVVPDCIVSLSGCLVDCYLCVNGKSISIFFRLCVFYAI
jgi:hypothetical protein